MAIDSGAILTLSGAGTHAENILFANNFPDNTLDSSKLVIASGTTFTGTVFGFTAGDQIDFSSLNSVSAHVSSATYDPIVNITTLSIMDSVNTDTIKLTDDYSHTTAWTFTNDGSGGAIMTTPGVNTVLTAGVDTVTLVDGTNRVSGTELTANNGDKVSGSTGTDSLTIDTGNVNHSYTFGDGNHTDIGLSNFENLTLTDASATNSHAITVTFDANFHNNGTITVDGSALTHLNGTYLTVDAHLALSDSFVIIGSASVDTITGGAGNDTIVGGGGGDALNGGPGADTFVFRAVTDSHPGTGNFDTITGFSHGSDHLDFSTISGLNDTIQAVTVTPLGSTPANIAAHTIDIVTVAGNTVIYANSTGASEAIASASMEIHLASAIGVTSADFILHH